jgi:hypothetical protein
VAPEPGIPVLISVVMDLSVYFEDLERRIKPAMEDHLAGEWLSFADCKLHEGYFAPSRHYSFAEKAITTSPTFQK